MSDNSVVSPWEMATSFMDLWDWTRLAWIGLTFLIVAILYKITTRAIRGRKASWTQFLLYSIKIMAWVFLMYMVMWEIITENNNQTEGLTLLVLTCLLSVSGNLLIFRALRNPKKTEWASRITSGIILSVVVFGVFIFMGIGQESLGLASLMGAVLGSLLSLVWYNLVVMMRDDGSDGANDPDMADDGKWRAPPP